MNRDPKTGIPPVKIIKLGYIEDDVRFKVECEKCRSLLELCKRNLIIDNDIKNETIYWFVCPVCGEPIYLSPKKLKELISTGIVYDMNLGGNRHE